LSTVFALQLLFLQEVRTALHFFRQNLQEGPKLAWSVYHRQLNCFVFVIFFDCKKKNSVSVGKSVQI